MSDDERDENYGYCNACGEEQWLGSDCCDDGEWVPFDEADFPAPLPSEETKR